MGWDGVRNLWSYVSSFVSLPYFSRSKSGLSPRVSPQRLHLPLKLKISLTPSMEAEVRKGRGRDREKYCV